MTKENPQISLSHTWISLQSKAKAKLQTATMPHPKSEEWRKFPFRGWDLKKIQQLMESTTQMESVPSTSDVEPSANTLKQLDQLMDSEDVSYFFLLNLAFATHFYWIPINNSDVSITASPSPDSPAFLPFFLVEGKANAQGTILLQLDSLSSSQDPLYLISSLFVSLNPGSQIKFVFRESLSSSTVHFHNHHSLLDKDSSLSAYHSAEGGFLSKEFWKVTLQGDGASAKLRGLSALSGREFKDIDFLLRHLGAHQDSDLLYKTVVKDKSHHIFTGNLQIPSTSKKSQANQVNHNLSLSPTARAESIPKLEVFAEDVRTSHGATVGEVSKDQMFYLQSRGLSPAEAKTLLVEGFFTELLDQFPDEIIREKIRNELFQKVFS